MKNKLFYAAVSIGILVLSGSVDSRPKPSIRRSQIVARGGLHQGSHSNSIAAIESAFRNGFKAIQLGVVMSEDKALVLNDGLYYRKTTPAGRLVKLDIPKLNFREYKADRYGKELRGLAGIEDLVSWLSYRESEERYSIKLELFSSKLNPEEKQTMLLKLQQWLGRMTIKTNIVLISADWEMIKLAKEILPEIPRGIVIDSRTSFNYWKYLFSPGSELVEVYGIKHLFLSKSMISKRVTDNFKSVGVHVTATDVDYGYQAENALADGADQVSSDFPTYVISEVAVHAVCENLLKAAKKH